MDSGIHQNDETEEQLLKKYSSVEPVETPPPLFALLPFMCV